MVKIFLPALYLMWAGMILGVSFIATPAKFQASQMTLPIALEVGKATFHFFNSVEWIIIALVAVLTAIMTNMQREWLIFILLTIMLTAQTFWLLPLLDVRSSAVIAGVYSRPGYTHWIYVALEVMKMLLVLTLALLYLKRTTV